MTKRIQERLASARATRVEPKLVEVAAGVAAPQSKPKKKKKPKAPAQLETALACSVLSIDAAETSGYAMWSRGALVDFGECDVFGDEPAQVFERFAALPAPHVIVVERPFRVRSSNSTGIGTGDKIWRELAKRRGFAKRIVRVYPSTWRSKTLPKGMASAKRDDVRPEELTAARMLVVNHLGVGKRAKVGDDSAPAILIGLWASYAPAVAKVLPKVRGPKMVKGTSIKFGRFAIRGKARKRIERATDGAAHMVGTWLSIDGVVPKRDEPIELAALERAEVQLGYAPINAGASSWRDSLTASAFVPYRATSAQIETGWDLVALQVEGQQDFKLTSPKKKRARKSKAAA